MKSLTAQNLLIVAIVYLACAFCTLDFNFANWTEDGRFFFLLLASVATAFRTLLKHGVC